ncbi:unnamed protein product [Macrosiphum euphorbiae]|uniref:Cuticle protein 6 n=1 Tax=Macrosiphum euphorbiae TaxID=13131 RepID=A0AAV0XJU9_9HEMI|nr:unnamed protein product [Macrosiphum euphorbiae]
MNSGLFLFAAAVVAVVSGSAVYPIPVHHAPATTQYHSQDELGQYAYGYSGGPSSKHEQRTADGVTSGGYSYVDANGLVQSLAYVSDPVNGFRVSGTNLPADSNTAHHAALPVVHQAAVPAVHQAAVPSPYYLAAAPAPLPVATSYSSVVHHAAAEPIVVKSPSYYVPAAHPLIKLAQPLTPASTSNVHYPEHAVLLAARKKRSAGLYPTLVSGYSAAPAHIVTVKHTEFAAPPAPIVHHLAAPSPYYLAAAPAPVATSYTSVTRHHEPAVAPVLAYAAPAPQVYAAPAPHAVYAAPALAPTVAVAPAKSQFHAQDEHGQYTYGYTDGASAKTETRYADGETRGSYSYVDPHGEVQAVHYSAGAEGFKAAGTTIPVHHV